MIKTPCELPRTRSPQEALRRGTSCCCYFEFYTNSSLPGQGSGRYGGAPDARGLARCSRRWGAWRPFPPLPAWLPSSPIHRPLCVQQLEDGLPIHVRGDVQTCDVQDGGGQVNVEDDVGVPGGGRESGLGSERWCPASFTRGSGGWGDGGQQGPQRSLCGPVQWDLPLPHPLPWCPDTPHWPPCGCFFGQECPPCSPLSEQRAPTFKSHPDPEPSPGPISDPLRQMLAPSLALAGQARSGLRASTPAGPSAGKFLLQPPAQPSLSPPCGLCSRSL